MSRAPEQPPKPRGRPTGSEGRARSDPATRSRPELEGLVAIGTVQAILDTLASIAVDHGWSVIRWITAASARQIVKPGLRHGFHQWRIGRVTQYAARDLVTLAGKLARWRAAGRLPVPTSGVADHAVRRLRPAHVEHLGQSQDGLASFGPRRA